MSALCCAAPSLNLMSAGTAGSLPVYHFSRPHQNYTFMAMEQQQHHQFGLDPFSSYSQQQQQQQQPFLMPQQQSASATSRARRKRLEEALTEAIPAASSGKVSQRIAQLQSSLYASCHPVSRIHRPSPAGSARPLSVDPCKDYSQPLTVDCSIEYDLPRVVRPPPGAKPLLLIARRPAAVRESPRQQWNCNVTTILQSSQQFIRPDCGYFVMNVAPVSSSNSDDSGRGTDSERTCSPVGSQQPWTSEPQWTFQQQHLHQQQLLKLNQGLPPASRDLGPAAESAARRTDGGCHCCPSRSVIPQRWAPYNTARHGCPAPLQQQQQQQHVDNWTTRWNNNDSSALDHLLSHRPSSSLMAFHI